MASLRSLLQYLATFALRKVLILLSQGVLLVQGQPSTTPASQRQTCTSCECMIDFRTTDSGMGDEASFSVDMHINRER